MTLVRPRTPREARVWNYLNGDTPFWEIRVWPQYLQALALKEHKVNRERFTLYFFLTANGLDPKLARDWVLMTDYVRRTDTANREMKIISQGYDRAAGLHIEQLYIQAGTGTLFQGRKRMYNMFTREIEWM